MLLGNGGTVTLATGEQQEDASVYELIVAGCAECGQITEGELRYQLSRRAHVLAESDELLRLLARMEKRGLIECELRIGMARA